RRHTSSLRDWSSDVCSSDLNEDALDPIFQAIHDLVDELAADHSKDERPIADETLQLVLMALGDALFGAPLTRALGLPRDRARHQIGRASCRERVERAMGAAL